VSRFLKNIIAAFSGEALSKISAICVSILLARYLGPKEYGAYTFVISFSYIFMVIVDFGLNDLIVRDVAKDRNIASQYFVEAMVIKAIFGVISIIVLPITVYIMGYPKDLVQSSLIFSFHLIFITLSSCIFSIFRAFERMEYVALGTAVNNGFLLLLTILLVLMKGTVNEILFSRVIAVFLGFLAAYFILIKRFNILRFHLNFYSMKQLLLRALPFLTIGIIYTLYFKLDIVMLSKMKGEIFVGWYSVAANDLFFGLLFIPGVISTVTYPMFARHYAESIEKFRQSCNLTIKGLTVFGVGISAGTFVLAPQIVQLIFGSEYRESIPVLRIIAFAIPFVFAREPIGYALAVAGRVKTLMWLNICSLFLNFVLNLVLIPIYAHIGATIASVVCIVLSLFLGIIS
jgi:O-antigen/teichoic acid export membrane protein